MQKKFIGLLLLLTVLLTVILGNAAAQDDENLSTIRSCSIYEVDRTGRYVQSFIGVPGLASGAYIAERVTFMFEK